MIGTADLHNIINNTYYHIPKKKKKKKKKKTKKVINKQMNKQTNRKAAAGKPTGQEQRKHLDTSLQCTQTKDTAVGYIWYICLWCNPPTHLPCPHTNPSTTERAPLSYRGASPP